LVTSYTVILIALVVAASLFAFQSTKIAREWVLEPYQVWQGKRVFTLFSAGLIHADWGHLLFNMITLYFFGSSVENFYTLGLDLPALTLPLLFFSGIVAANIPVLLIFRKDRNYATLGASGGVAAVLFASVLIDPFNNVCFYFALCMPGVVAAILYLVYSVYQSRRGQGNINHEGHLAGAVYGLLWQTVLTPQAWGALYKQVLDLF